MPADYRLLLRLPESGRPYIKTPNEAQAEAQMRAMRDQAMQVQALEAQQRVKQIKDQQDFEQLMGQTGGDVQAAQKLLWAKNPALAIRLQDHLAKQQTAQALAADRQAQATLREQEQQRKNVEYVHKRFAAINALPEQARQPEWDRLRGQLVKTIGDEADPGEYAAEKLPMLLAELGQHEAGLKPQLIDTVNEAGEPVKKFVLPEAGKEYPQGQKADREKNPIAVHRWDPIKRRNVVEYIKPSEAEGQTFEAPEPARIVFPPAPKPDKLIKVEHQDASGKTVIEWLPESEVRGQTFKKGVGSTVENRLAASETVAKTGNDIITMLQRPDVAAQLGPAMGRFNKLRDFLGNPPPQLAELAGAIESFALANMGVHGMRSVQGANQISALMDKKHTPESLIATIKGLTQFSRHFMETEGREAPALPGATAAPAGGGYGLTYQDYLNRKKR